MPATEAASAIALLLLGLALLQNAQRGTLRQWLAAKFLNAGEPGPVSPSAGAGASPVGGPAPGVLPGPSAPSAGALTGAQVARHAGAAGFAGEALVTAVAIARAESGWRPGAVGDVGLQTGVWGPSIGLWQIRSLNAQRGTGLPRDASRLTDPAFNARAAWAISGQGSNWRPWTVYKTGAYRAYLPAARAAVAAL